MWAPSTASDVALVIVALSVPSALLVLAIVARGYDVRIKLTRTASRRAERDTPGDTPTGGHEDDPAG